MILVEIVVFVVVGAAAGWVATNLVKGFGFGHVGNIFVGIAGAVIAKYLIPVLANFFSYISEPGIIFNIVSATIGAVVLLLVLRMLKRQ